MTDLKKLIPDYNDVLSKMFSIFELKKKYATKVLMNVEKVDDSYITFDEQSDGKIEINLRMKYRGGETICGVMEDEFFEPLEHFEKNLKQFREDFIYRKLQEEKDITLKGFTEIDYIKIGFKSYPRIKIVKSTGVIDFHDFQTIKCSWDRPIEKSTADNLLKLRKKDLVLTDGDVDFICHKINKITLATNKTLSGTSVCFGMTIEFKKGERVKK
jgi:Holliday junction resolvase